MKKYFLAILFFLSPFTAFADIVQDGYTYSSTTPAGGISWNVQNTGYITTDCDIWVFNGSGNYVTSYGSSGGCAGLNTMDSYTIFGGATAQFYWVMTDSVIHEFAATACGSGDTYSSCISLLSGSTYAEWDGGQVNAYLGCTDPSMFNYNPSANIDDGSCTPIVYGCTDSTKFNYNPSANTDDGSCYDLIKGCSNPTATNYSSSTNYNSYTCSYTPNPLSYLDIIYMFSVIVFLLGIPAIGFFFQFWTSRSKDPLNKS